MKTSDVPKFAIWAHVGTVACTLALAAVMLGGCASPGPPLPPTLNLPEEPAATGLSADREGASVIVHWTTPERTTDKLLIKGKVQAEICREVVRVPAASRPAANGTLSQTAAALRPCTPVVQTVAATPGQPGEAVDTLPTELATGPARLLAYCVQLKNAAGRTAGPSSEVFAAAGNAPGPVADFRARAAKGGVVLEWVPETAGDEVMLLRTAIQPATPPRTAAQKRTQDPLSALSAPKDPAEVRLRAGGTTTGASQRDPGGMIDRSAEMGQSYSYVAWRVRRVEVGGHQLEVRGAMSPAVPVKFEDVFAPDAPQGLVAVPAFAGEGNAARAAIDLSWEPTDEPHVAGYRVYRQERGDAAAGGWQRISGPQPLPVAAYRDTGVVAAHRYAYRITAVGVNGLESPASAVAEETAATQ